jgi:hypothetical protein
MLPSVVAVRHEQPVDIAATNKTAKNFKLRIILPFLPKWIVHTFALPELSPCPNFRPGDSRATQLLG